ncbi:uncharacterized protein LOC144470920 isoform X2 [Augochlora pura]
MEKDREDIKKYAMEQGVIEKKDDKKLDWMYKGPNQMINREEYLLGRPIDKSFEQMNQTEKDSDMNQVARNHVEHECIPPSLRFFSGNEQVDLARKMQEDPLYAIKKKEMETRNQLLKNPVKLKQLRQLLEQQSKKSKIEKKKKRKKQKQDIDSDDETQLDMLLAAKYKKLKDKINDEDLMKSMKKIKHKRKKKRKESESSSSSESDSSSEDDTSDESTEKRTKEKRSRNKENGIQSKKNDREKYSEKFDKRDERRGKVSEKRSRNRSSSKERSDSSNRRKRYREFKRDEDKNRHKEYQHNTFRNKEHNSHKSEYSNRNTTGNKYIISKLNYKESTNSFASAIQEKYKDGNRYKDQRNPKKRSNLTEEEKERRRQEMMANATWRDKEREKNVKKYTEDEKKEIDNGKGYNQDFVRKHLAAAAELGSVASRIKANINNIQRSGRAMDTNFAKR